MSKPPCGHPGRTIFGHYEICTLGCDDTGGARKDPLVVAAGGLSARRMIDPGQVRPNFGGQPAVVSPASSAAPPHNHQIWRVVVVVVATYLCDCGALSTRSQPWTTPRFFACKGGLHSRVLAPSGRGLPSVAWGSTIRWDFCTLCFAVHWTDNQAGVNLSWWSNHHEHTTLLGTRHPASPDLTVCAFSDCLASFDSTTGRWMY